jgi:hypothetical protein
MRVASKELESSCGHSNPKPIPEQTMSAPAEAIISDLELSLDLNKETIQDLDVDPTTAGQIKGGWGLGPVLSPSTIVQTSGTSVIAQNPSGGRV